MNFLSAPQSIRYIGQWPQQSYEKIIFSTCIWAIESIMPMRLADQFQQDSIRV